MIQVRTKNERAIYLDGFRAGMRAVEDYGVQRAQDLFDLFHRPNGVSNNTDGTPTQAGGQSQTGHAQ